jgi:8-oxo-dGTP diphosphatase
LMGGFLGETEDTDAAAARVLMDLTGLTDVYLEQLQAFSSVERDPGARVVSVAYSALINIAEHNHESVNSHNAFWVKYDEIPELIFDHKLMVEKAIARLRRKAATMPIGFNLLPEKFTLTQLQKLYEAIYQRDIDKRNFRKKLLSTGVLNKLTEKDKKSSRRGAFLFTFNNDAYKRLEQDGGMFGVNI